MFDLANLSVSVIKYKEKTRIPNLNSGNYERRIAEQDHKLHQTVTVPLVNWTGLVDQPDSIIYNWYTDCTAMMIKRIALHLHVSDIWRYFIVQLRKLSIIVKHMDLAHCNRWYKLWSNNIKCIFVVVSIDLWYCNKITLEMFDHAKFQCFFKVLKKS